MRLLIVFGLLVLALSNFVLFLFILLPALLVFLLYKLWFKAVTNKQDNYRTFTEAVEQFELNTGEQLNPTLVAGPIKVKTPSTTVHRERSVYQEWGQRNSNTNNAAPRRPSQPSTENDKRAQSGQRPAVSVGFNGDPNSNWYKLGQARRKGFYDRRLHKAAHQETLLSYRHPDLKHIMINASPHHECRICASADGVILSLRVEVRSPSLPHKGCTCYGGECCCYYTAVFDDEL